VLGIFLRMYRTLTNRGHLCPFELLRSEKLAQGYAKTSFALLACRA
jgi:hypothetical protein